jgi:hypothetical protein
VFYGEWFNHFEIIGSPLLHHNWVTHSLRANKLLPFVAYSLPSGCSGLHSYNVFPVGQEVAAPGAVAGPPLCRQLPQQLLLANTKVLNLAGAHWDNALLAAGATVVQCSAVLLEGLHKTGGAQHGGNSRGAPRQLVDVILVDPYEYSQSITSNAKTAVVSSAGPKPVRGKADSGSHGSLLSLSVPPKSVSPRSPTNQSRLQSSGPSSASGGSMRLGELELSVLQNCCALAQKVEETVFTTDLGNSSVPQVVSTDWLVHCLSLNEWLNPRSLDLFTLPPNAKNRPFTFKSQSKATGSVLGTGGSGRKGSTPASVNGGGERYTKYDIVYFHKDVNVGVSGTGNTVSTERRKLDEYCIGKIVEFLRRSDSSPLFARIRMMVPVLAHGDAAATAAAGGSPRGEVGRSGTSPYLPSHRAPPRVAALKELTGDPHSGVCVVEVDRLAGKVVLLHPDDFRTISAGYGAEEEDVYFASQEWLDEHKRSTDSYSSGAVSSADANMPFRHQASQDY